MEAGDEESAITVDPRIGSAELAAPLRARGHLVLEEYLDSADVAFMGIGHEGCPTFIGIERKTLGDLFQCISDGRFAGGQLATLHQMYEWVYLVVEGVFRQNSETGMVEVPKGKSWGMPPGGVIRYSAVEHWLMTIQFKGGVTLARTSGKYATVNWISMLYSWWRSKKGWDGHRAHEAMNKSQASGLRANLRKPTMCEKWAIELPGIGVEKARRVAKHFRSPYRMATASPKEWMEIPKARIGKGLATSVVNAIESEE